MSPHLPALVLLCLSVVQLSVADDEQLVEITIPKSVPKMGAWNEISPDSHAAKRLALKAVEIFNNHHKAKKLFRLVSISSAKVQVTNEINYDIEVVIGRTKCFKGENHALNSCKFEKKRRSCNFSLSFDYVKDKYKMVDSSCKLPEQQPIHKDILPTPTPAPPSTSA